MEEKVRRYDWEDALIEAEVMGIISPAQANMCFRLAKAINWSARNRPAGLYWDNETAAQVVGVARATLYRNMPDLKTQGYLTVVNGNLLPTIPESHVETKRLYQEHTETLSSRTKKTEAKSHVETKGLQTSHEDLNESQSDTNESHVETSQSHVETTKSQVDNPYSVDTYSDDSCSVDTFSDEASAAASASHPPLVINKEDGDFSSLSITEETDVFGGEVPQSQVETGREGEDSPAPEGVFRKRIADYDRWQRNQIDGIRKDKRVSVEEAIDYYEELMAESW